MSLAAERRARPVCADARRARSQRERTRVCVVGSGSRFLSGISYYTYHVAIALADSFEVSVVLMRRLLPARFYPGRERVGAELVRFAYPSGMRVFDGVDWFAVPSLVRSAAFVARARPQVLLLQWWTGTVLHSYLLLALIGRLLGARVVVEFHELLDSGELRLPPARAYVRLVAPLLVRLSHGFVFHSDYDRSLLAERYRRLAHRPSAVIPHGPYDRYATVEDYDGRDDGASTAPQATDDMPAAPTRLLYFGVIRPFKGLEDLIEALDSMPPEEADGYHLTVVGETWEGWTLPAERIGRSRYRDRIDFVNRYVADAEVGAFFSEADAVVLPYHRSSSSGPLHLAMSHGLPVVVTDVGGLTEAIAGYEGAVPVPPRDPAALRRALAEAAQLKGRRFADVHSWDRSVERYDALFRKLLSPRTPARWV